MKLIIQKNIILSLLFWGNSLVAFSEGIIFQSDSVQTLLGLAQVSQAQEYLDSFKNQVFKRNDTLKVQWFIESGRVSMSKQEGELAFGLLQDAIQLAVKLPSKKHEIDAKVQLLEWYRKERFYENGMRLFQELLPQKDISLNSRARLLHRAAALCNEYGVISARWNYLDSAISYSKRSLQVSERYGFKEHQATSYTELGSIYKYKKDFEAAERYFKKSMKICKDFDHDNYINVLNNLGSVYLEQYQSDSALFYLTTAFNEIKNGNNYVMLTDINRSLKWAYLQKGDSLGYYKTTVAELQYGTQGIKQQLNSKIHDLTLAYESQQKDEIIERSRQENDQVILITIFLSVVLFGTFLGFVYVRKSNSKLKKLLDENEFLVGESNHRIKNNLQLIISLIGREVFKSEEKKPELVELSDKINSIAALHQHLYLKEAKENVGANEYVHSILDNFGNAFNLKGIFIHAQIESFELQIEKAMYLGLLVTELITNTLKHAFPEGFEKEQSINLWIEKKDGCVRLSYHDSGRGLPLGKSPALIGILQRQLKAEIVPTEGLGYVYQIKFKR